VSEQFKNDFWNKCYVIAVCVVCSVQSQLQARSAIRHTAAHPPLQSSLSLPLETIYHTDLPGVGTSETVLPIRLPAPKLAADRRTQSIGEQTTLFPGVGQDIQGTSKQASTTAPTRYKTELCRPFEENGTCRYGNKCQFAHGKAELRSVARHPKYKTDLCKTFHTTGLCPYGPRCHFIHNDEERRSSESSSEQMRQQLAAAQEIGRRSTSLQHSLEGKPRLQRQYSEYQPSDESRQRGVQMPGSARIRPRMELQRRASSVADAVIRDSIGYPHQLQPVLETDQYSPLNLNTVTRSMGSVANSSSASSVTDSPSPSPTAGLLLPTAEDSVVPTAPVCPRPAVPAGWSGEDDHAKAVLLAELVARLGLQDIAALIQVLKQPGNTTRNIGGLLPRGVDGSDVDVTVPQWPADILTKYSHNQYQYERNYQQPQHGSATSNICW